MLNWILADASITISNIFDTFTSVWGSVTSFIAGEPVLLAVVGVPLVAGLVAIIMRIFR